jgi:lysozyme family protein
MSRHPATKSLLSYEHLRPEYAELWKRVNTPEGFTPPGKVSLFEEARGQVALFIQPDAKKHFVEVERLTGVPWFVTAIILTLEAGSPPNFHAWLHNGDPMFDHAGHPRRTVNVPAHRPPNPKCSWEGGAVDCYGHERFIDLKDWCPELVAWVLESMNGFGYREYHHIRSPYLWGGTCVQQIGKYDRDRHFNKHKWDSQIGGMALLAALMKTYPEEGKFS